MPGTIPNGALTALVTPFLQDGRVDSAGFDKLVEFQKSQGISGIVPVGTTGESATLDEVEHGNLIYRACAKGIFAMPGCGSNSTKEALHYVDVAARCGAKAVLLVDPYYNGPSSLEIRESLS